MINVCGGVGDRVMQVQALMLPASWTHNATNASKGGGRREEGGGRREEGERGGRQMKAMGGWMY